jgi:hypothetical protein
MKTTKTSRIGIPCLGLAAALLLSPPAHATCDCSTLPTLGRAADWPALGIGNITVELQGSAWANSLTVPGNIGVTGAAGNILVQGNALVGGTAGHEFGSTVACIPAADCPTMIPGGIVEQDMSGPAADAIAASALFAAMTPTQTYGGLNRSTSMAGNGCINVIQVNGDIDLNGNETIKLSGTSEDYFVINLTGDLITDGTADIELDGMEPSHVIFNMTTPGAEVELGGGSGGDFTILNPFGEIYLHGNSGGRGAYYAGQNRLFFQGNADFYGNPFACGNASCPDPELTGANIQAPATPQGRSLGNSSFFYAWFDLNTYEGHLEHYRLTANGTIMDESGVDAIDGVTNEFSATRDPYFDAAIPLRSDTSRILYTTISGARVDFDNTNVSDVDLDLQDGEIPAYPNYPASGIDDKDKLRDAVIDFLYGEDAFSAVVADQGDLRPTVLGDIFHSNPLFIGTPTTLLMHEDGYASFYSSYYQRDRVVYAGANDGIFHAFDAGAWYDPSDPAEFNGGTGEELFGYVPGLLLPNVKLVPRTDDETGERLVPSFIDGNIVAADAWLGDGSGSDISKTADEWATVVVAAFREGGKGYLAIDATDPDATSGTPHYPYPKLLWEFTDSLMAESWSRPVITRVKLAGASLSGDHCGRADGDGDCREVWVAVFGAGYIRKADPNDDDYIGDPTSLAWNGVGKALFMVRLDNGQILDSVVFDAADTVGHDDMKYAISSQPAVLDIDGDRFADIILVGDVGGQLWKWDVSAKGVDGADADSLIDNWPSGIFFNAAPVTLTSGDTHYKSMYSPASAAWVNGTLVYAFGTGERRNLLYEGDGSADDNNRIYVIRDPSPTGNTSIPVSPYTEANLTNVTATATDGDLTDMGYFVIAEESEKFITDFLIFAGHAIAASYKPSFYPTCAAGEAFLYTFRLYNAAGYFDANATPEAADRYYHIGSGIPSTPRISIAPNPSDDIGFINTSDKEVLDFEPPLRDDPDSSVIYWKQEF